MRLLQIDAGDKTVVELHPYVSVVQGLDDALRNRLIDTVAGLPSGQAPSVSGMLEAHGVFLDLTGDTLRLLDLADGDLEVVVRAKDLPGSALSPAARQLRSRQQVREDQAHRLDTARRDLDAAARRVVAAEEVAGRARRAFDETVASAGQRLGNVDEVTAQIDQLTNRRRSLESALGEAGPAVKAAEAARDEIEATTADVRGQRRDAAERCSTIAALLEEVRGGLDPDAEAAVAAATEHLAAVEAQNAAEVEAEERARAEGEEAIAPEAPAERVERLSARMEELRGLLAALTPVDRVPVEDALRYMQHLDELEQVPSADAFTLADELERLDSALLSATRGLEADGERLAAARARLDSARQALLEAEQAMRAPELDRADIDALEAAHHELLLAQDRADTRFGGGRAQRRLEDARTAENAILERLGFTTYADFMMGTSILHVDAQREGALDRARTELADAEDDWNELQVAVDAELARAELHDHRRTARERARALLGSSKEDDDLVAELRAMRVPAVAPEEAASAITSALAVVGLALDEDSPDPDALVFMAEMWLEEDDLAAARREEALAELRQLDLEHAEATAEVRDSDAESLAPTLTIDPEHRRRARHDEAVAGLAAAESLVARHRKGSDDVERLQNELNEAAVLEQSAAERSTDADRLVADAEADVAAAIERARLLEIELDEVRLAEENATDELRSLEGGHDADERPSLEADMAERAAELERAQEAMESLRADVSRMTTELDALDVEIQQLSVEAAAAGSGDAPAADEVEWYLLARLAAQRSVSYAGSVPLLIDDALRGLEPAEVRHLLDRLERMAAAVQVIYISDDPGVAAWAAVAGPDRAAVVSPEPAPA